MPRPARFERPRPRLLEALASALDMPLVVLAAPSGYGKTTLLAQYARSTTRRVVWCRVGGVHDGPGELFAQLNAGLPGPGAPPLDPRTPPDTLARHLSTRLAELEGGTDLIVDNVLSEALARWLAQLADLLEEGDRVLLSSYTTDGLRLAHRLAEGEVLVLDAQNLAFDAEETKAYLHDRGSALEPGAAAYLAGWPAGLALAAHSLRRSVDADDLVREALEALPEQLVDGLSDLAPLDVWSLEDASLLSPALPNGWLRAVQRAGLPVVTLGGGSVQPHQLLVRVLDQQLQLDPQRARRARTVAAQLAERSGAPERAAELYVQAGEMQAAVRLAHALAARYRDRGEHRLTRHLLEAIDVPHLPDALLERLAWAQIETGAASEGEGHLQRLHSAGRLSPAGLASLAMVRGRQGQASAQYALAQEGLARLGGEAPLVPALFWPLAQAALKLGQGQEAEAAAERFVRLAEHHGDPVRLAEAWQLQGLVWGRTRTPQAAAAPLGRARQLYETLGWTGRASALRLSELELALRQGELAGVAAHLRALESAYGPEQATFHVQRLRLLGSALRRGGQVAEAELALRQGLDLAQRGSLSPVHTGLTLALADCALQRHAAAEAAEWLAFGGELTDRPPDTQLTWAVLQALISAQPLDAALTTVAAELDAETRARAALLLAGQGVASALALAQTVLRNHPQLLLCDAALQTRLRGTVVGAVLEGQGGGPLQAPPDEVASWTLQIVTLGDFGATLDGRALQIRLVKARELLVWLALHGSGSRDQLVTALWDGSGEERHVEYFRVAVRCLRAALRQVLPAGPDPLPYAAGRYRLLPELTVDLDVSRAPDASWLQPFLPGTDTEWVTTFRTQLGDQAVAALLGAATAAPPPVAVGLFGQLLAADPLHSAAHEGLIRALLDSGESRRAAQALGRYRQMLKREFGAALPAAFAGTLPSTLGT